MCFEGKLLQNRLRADKNELRSLLTVGHQRGGFCTAKCCISILFVACLTGDVGADKLFDAAEISHVQYRVYTSYACTYGNERSVISSEWCMSATEKKLIID